MMRELMRERTHRATPCGGPCAAGRVHPAAFPRPAASASGPSSSLRPFHRAAFSLLEVMLVLVIIGLVAGLITMNVRGQLSLAKRNAAKSDIANLASAVDQFYLIQGRYPTSQEGLEVLTKPTGSSQPLLKAASLTDPWGRPYEYNSPGLKHPYEIISYGADGKEGGEGPDKDVNCWNLKEHNDDQPPGPA